MYPLLPLGRSPDPGQTGWAGSPLVSAYVEGAGLRAMCAVQLMAQAGVAGPDDYLNLSGLAYDLKPSGTAAFFAAARAATALDLIRGGPGKARPRPCGPWRPWPGCPPTGVRPCGGPRPRAVRARPGPGAGTP